MRRWERQVLSIQGHEVMTYSLGEGPNTLLLVHGGPGCPSLYLRDSHEALATEGWRLVTWDQLGCGESPCTDARMQWSLDRSVDEMEAVRTSLGLGDIDVLGQSWGGVLGLEYVLRHRPRVKRFIAADTAFDLQRMQRGFEAKKMALGVETCTMMAKHEAMGTTSHPEYQAAVTLMMHRHVCRLHPWPDSLGWCMQNLGTGIFSDMFGPYFFQCTGNIRNWDRMDALWDLQTPVLLIHGEASTETASTFGFGSQAGYDGTLNDAAIRQAVSEAVSRLSTDFNTRPWQTAILKTESDRLFISGGKLQGLQPGMLLTVQTAGEKVKSPQTGATITLPGRAIAQIRIDALFGDNELNEGSVASILSGSLDGYAFNQLVVRVKE